MSKNTICLYFCTRRYSSLQGPTSSSCRGLWPLVEAFFPFKQKGLIMLFWCSVLTSLELIFLKIIKLKFQKIFKKHYLKKSQKIKSRKRYKQSKTKSEIPKAQTIPKSLKHVNNS